MAGTLTAATIDSGAASTPPTFSANGTQIGTLCRAWCLFNGTLTGTNAPTAAFNVSSVTRNGAGDYTITFSNAMPDTSYSLAGLGGPNNVTNTPLLIMENSNSPRTTTSVRIYNLRASGTGTLDSLTINLSVFR